MPNDRRPRFGRVASPGEVNLVFEGAGVRLLKRGYHAWLSGPVGGFFTRIVERVMRREIGWPVPRESIGILADLGAHFYVCGPSMVGYDVREEESDRG